jgi:hypothetical protein
MFPPLINQALAAQKNLTSNPAGRFDLVPGLVRVPETWANAPTRGACSLSARSSPASGPSNHVDV